jgi:hypothetical protein
MGCCFKRSSKIKNNQDVAETSGNERKKLTLVRSPGLKLSQKEMMLASKSVPMLSLKQRHLVRLSDPEFQ